VVSGHTFRREELDVRVGGEEATLSSCAAIAPSLRNHNWCVLPPCKYKHMQQTPISAQAYGASGMPTGLQGSLAKFITCISDTDLTQLMQGLHKALDNVKAGHTSLPASRLQVHAVCRIFQAARSAQSSS